MRINHTHLGLLPAVQITHWFSLLLFCNPFFCPDNTITRESGRVVGWGGWNLHTFVHSHTPQHRHRGSKQSNAVLHTAPVHVLFICLLKHPETLFLSTFKLKTVHWQGHAFNTHKRHLWKSNHYLNHRASTWKQTRPPTRISGPMLCRRLWLVAFHLWGRRKQMSNEMNGNHCHICWAPARAALDTDNCKSKQIMNIKTVTWFSPFLLHSLSI